MSADRPKDVPASVRRRLLVRARVAGVTYNELEQHYAIERFLFRLSRSPHADRFVLKGALVLLAWQRDTATARPTRDIDLLGRTENSVERIVSIMRDICRMDLRNDDGLAFDPESVAGERIAEADEYQGVRVRFRATLGKARISLQVDVGFGDTVYPAPERIEYPTILGMPSPALFGYSRESFVAEKLEAIISLGELTSRMKDFHDLWFVSRRFDFDGKVLSTAIRATFERRDTRIDPASSAFSDSFAASKRAQWTAFRDRVRGGTSPPDFAEVGRAVREFVVPIFVALEAGDEFTADWRAPGPWESNA